MGGTSGTHEGYQKAYRVSVEKYVKLYNERIILIYILETQGGRQIGFMGPRIRKSDGLVLSCLVFRGLAWFCLLFTDNEDKRTYIERYLRKESSSKAWVLAAVW
jgi:hypothetical protein